MTYLEPTSDLYERERIILEYIKKYPDKHHNALISMIVPECMAKATFEKTRDSLLEKEIICVQKKGNMKFYYGELKLPPPTKPEIIKRIESNNNIYGTFNPITRTLPQVKSVTLWKPIIRSVIKKDTINAGINLKPNIAGI